MTHFASKMIPLSTISFCFGNLKPVSKFQIIHEILTHGGRKEDKVKNKGGTRGKQSQTVKIFDRFLFQQKLKSSFFSVWRQTRNENFQNKNLFSLFVGCSFWLQSLAVQIKLCQKAKISLLFKAIFLFFFMLTDLNHPYLKFKCHLHLQCSLFKHNNDLQKTW